jgi:hypothetical protein
VGDYAELPSASECRGAAGTYSVPRPSDSRRILDDKLDQIRTIGVEPEQPPYRPGGRGELPLIAFVSDPDGYRIEIIDGGSFRTPQDPRD